MSSPETERFSLRLNAFAYFAFSLHTAARAPRDVWPVEQPPAAARRFVTMRLALALALVAGVGAQSNYSIFGQEAASALSASAGLIVDVLEGKQGRKR
jgi:hypothetical protein